jgi:hypothetical protein
MTPDRINSTGLPVIKSEILENNRRSGNNYTRVYTGSFATMAVQRLIDIAGGATSVKSESLGDGNYQVTAYYPWDVTNGSNAEAPVNSHELDENFETVDVFNSVNMWSQLTQAFGSLAGASGAMSFLIGTVTGYNQAIQAEATPQNPTPIATAMANAEGSITTTYAGGQQTLMLNLFRGICYKKITTAKETRIVYNRRITAATYNQIQASFVGAGQIWTTAEVIAFERTPAQWWFQLPGSLLWFKSNPKVLTVSKQKTEVTFSYTSCVMAWSGTDVAYNSAVLLSF